MSNRLISEILLFSHLCKAILHIFQLCILRSPMEGVFNHSLEFGNGHLLCSNTCLWDAGTVPLEPEVTFTIWSSLFLSWTISDHFQVVLVGRFTVGVRASRHRAVRSTLDHWLSKTHFQVDCCILPWPET